MVGSDTRGFDGGKLINGCKRQVAVDTPGLVPAIVKRSDDMHGFVVLPKRCIVERFFAHLMRTRRESEAHNGGP